MIKQVCLLLITVSFILSCKKKEAEPATTNNNSTTGGVTTGSNPSTVTTTLSPSNGGDFSGLQTTYTYLDYNGALVKDSSVFASFYATPPTSVAPTTIYAGTVTLNGTTIPFNSGTNSYYNATSSPINISGALSWSVSGSGTVTPFGQSFVPSYPKYTGGNLLPDTCVKANGVTINISGVTNNQNSVTVRLYSSSANAFKYIMGSNGSVNFSSADLNNFTVNQPVTIIVGCANIFSATHNGIKHGFINNISYQKTSYMK